MIFGELYRDSRQFMKLRSIHFGDRLVFGIANSIRCVGYVWRGITIFLGAMIPIIGIGMVILPVYVIITMGPGFITYIWDTYIK